MNSKKEKLARFGLISKGLVYLLIGGLTALAAFNLGGSKTGSSNALEFIAKQDYGKILLIITATGLVCYALWRVYEAFVDTEDHGNDFKGIGIRIGFALSGSVYGLLAFSAFKIVIGSSSNSGGGSSKFQDFFATTLGTIVLVLVAIGIAGKAFYKLYSAYSGHFEKKLKEHEMDEKHRKTLLRLGKIGYAAKGIVISIVAFLFIKAAFTTKDVSAADKEGAFSFLQNTFGSFILGIIALGLIAYALYIFTEARYRRIKV